VGVVGGEVHAGEADQLAGRDQLERPHAKTVLGEVIREHRDLRVALRAVRRSGKNSRTAGSAFSAA